MKIIDSHFHLYKSEQAGIMAQGGERLIGFSGTVEEAVPILDRGRIRKIMALAVIPIASMRQAAVNKWSPDTTPRETSELSRELEEKLLSRLTSYNDWLCRTARGDGRIEPVIAADATVDTDAMVAEIRSKFETYSIKALKIHPAVNNLSPSDPSYQPIFELARELNLTVVSHGGLSGEDPEGRYCSPENFRPVLERFPGLKLVVAHLAYPHVEGLLELASEFPNLCTDISFVMTHSPLTDDRISEVVKKFGPERILFGSDFPWSDPEKDMDRLEKMKLRDGEIDMLVWENAIRIFDL